jgi:hypothetical protein
MIEWSRTSRDRGYDLLAVDDWDDQATITAYSLAKKGRKYIVENM